VIQRGFHWLNATAVLEASVAWAWQAAFARAIDFEVPLSRQALLFSSVWLVYTADRWLDVRPRALGYHPTYRHGFVSNYRMPLLVLWFMTLTASFALACLVLNRDEWLRCSGLLAAALIYTAVVQGARSWQQRFCACGAKQVAVAALFASGVALFTQPAGYLPASLRGPSIGFFCLALLNLGLIASWECERDPAAASDALIWAGRHVPRCLRALLIGAVAVSATLWWFAPTASTSLWAPLLLGFTSLL